jgi:hypothetical protein
VAKADSFNNKGKTKSLRNLAIIILLAAILIPVSVMGVMYVLELRTEAGPTEKPQEVEVSNLLDTTATITWTTLSAETTGYVKFGTTSAVENVAFDTRDVSDATGSYELHYIDLIDLNPGTVYHYAIVVGGKEYKNGNEYYKFKTGPMLDVIDTPKPVKGSVEDPSGGNEELIVYMYVQKEDVISNKISTITSDKNYTLDLANLRTSDLNELFTDLDGATLHVFADGAGRGEGSITTEILLVVN